MPRKSKEELKNNISEVTSEVTTKTKTTASSKSKKETKSEKASSAKATSKSTRSTKTSSAKPEKETSAKAVSKTAATKKSTVSKSEKAATRTAAKSAKAATTSKSTSRATKATSASKTAELTKAVSTSEETTSKNKDAKSEKATKTAKAATKKASTSKTATKAKSKNVLASEVEYYDLPYRYNETVVKILAQTPTTLFIYWDISDEDRNSYVEQYGEDFFSSTKPVLIITNKTMNYTFEVEINDFANSWYLHVNDPDCDYSIELGRRPIRHFESIDSYIHVATSNDMEMPNNHILFDRLGKSVFFKNIKNNYVQEKEVSSISFIKNIGKYGIYEIYRELYKDSLDIEQLKEQDLRLNLSSSSSSGFTAF